MTEQINENRLTRLKEWGWLVAAIALVLLNRLFDAITPDYPYYHDGQILYPLLAHYGTVQSVVLVLLVVVLILGFLRRRMIGIWRVVMISMSIPLCFGLLLMDISPGYDHLDDLELGTHTYHLGFSYGSEPEFDYFLYVYTVWECDGGGLLCARMDNPHLESKSPDILQIPKHDVRFIYDESESKLYVQVDADMYPVQMNITPVSSD